MPVLRLSPARAKSLLGAAVLSAACLSCSEGLSNAPGVNRQWTQQDFEHDAIANGPESCSKQGQDPLAPPGQQRRACRERPAPALQNVPATR